MSIAAFNTAQARAMDQDNRNMAVGVGGAPSMSSVLNYIYQQLALGNIGIASAAPDVDALCLGGGACTWNPDGASGLNFAYNAGRIYGGNTVISVSAGTIALAASSTNYIEVDRTGTVYTNTSGFTAGRCQLMTVVTGASSITSVTNARALLTLLGPGAVSGAMLTTPGQTKSIDKGIASVSATTAITFTAPVTGVISKVVFVCATAVSTNGSNYWTWALVNKGAGGTGTTQVLDTGVTNTTNTTGSAIVAYVARTLLLNATSANQNVNANDVLELTITATGSPTTLTEVSVRIDVTFTS